MPPQRSVLGTISGNRAFNHQLSPFQRGKVIGLTIGGKKSSFIEELLDVSRGAIRSTLTLDHLRDDGNPQFRTGRPLEYIEADERNLV